MTYTFWSHGELLGESALDYVRCIPRLRTGDLHVTTKGLTVFDRISQTHADGYYALRQFNRETAQGAAHEPDGTTFHADFAAEDDQYQALALELRAPNGTVIPTEDIFVRDTEYLLAIAREAEEEDESRDPSAEADLDPDMLRELEEHLEAFEDDHPPWLPEAPEREPVRFQVHVRLQNEWSIP